MKADGGARVVDEGIRARSFSSFGIESGEVSALGVVLRGLGTFRPGRPLPSTAGELDVCLMGGGGIKLDAF